MRTKSVDLLKKMVGEKIWMGPTLTGVGRAHALGGLRMGDDATNSVVNADLMTHEVPNLYVMSGAVFPSCPGINPTLTIQALSWRAADSLAHEWKRGRGL
jgi:gluconate 2-dehydrogenase alpha chain